MTFQVSDRRVGYILNKSENATPELYATYMQINASQYIKWKCIWMWLGDWVTHYGFCHEETHELKAI